MPTFAAKQALIPSATRLDVANTDERLWMHNLSNVKAQPRETAVENNPQLLDESR